MMSESSEEFFKRLVNSIEEANAKQTRALEDKIVTEITTVKTEITDIKEIVQKQSNKQKNLEHRQTDLEAKYESLQRTLKKKQFTYIWTTDRKY